MPKSKEPKYKQAAIETRRMKVLTMYLFDCTQEEMAKFCGCSVRTIAEDLIWAKEEISNRTVSFRQVRDNLTLSLKETIKSMKLVEMNTRGKSAKFNMLRKLADIQLNMWVKLIPSEIHLGVRSDDKDLIPPDIYKQMEKDMDKLANDGNESAENN